MRSTPSHPSRRAPRTAVLTALVAIVVAVTGFVASTHGHVPAADGWHDATPHGSTAHDQGLNSCSICRLAHETSAGPVAPGAVSEPLVLIAPRTDDRSSFVLAVSPREHSPRAPPCLASC